MNHEVKRSIRQRPWWPIHHLLLVFALFAGNAMAQMKVVDGVLQEANGTPFVMRGVNVAHAWYRDKTAQTLKDVAARKANTVRIVLSNGVKWTRTDEAEVKGLVEQSKAAKLIVMLEVHDTTGYGEQAGMSTLDQAADYWVAIKNALIGQEDHVLVNIGNEPTGNGQPSSLWIDGHKNAIAKIRAAGIRNTLVVDAANWGQDWEGIMRSNAAAVLASDPLRNTVLSIHMYAVYPTDSAVNSYLSAFVSAKLPIIVGEFGDAFQGQPVAAAAIMARARQYGVGYLGWSWSGNGGADAALDLVTNFDGNSLSSWGNLLFNSSDGITATAKTATIFGGPSTDLPPAAPSVTAAAGNARVTLNWGAVASAQSYVVTRALSANGSFTAIATLASTATTYTDTQVTNGVTYHYRVTASNSAGTSPAGTASATPSAPASGGACSLTLDTSNDWGTSQVLRLTLANHGTTPITGWTVSFTESNVFSIQTGWNATFSASGRTLNVTPADWTRTIAPGGKVEAGLQISYAGGRPVPSNVSTAGLNCEVTVR